ncbi:MAG: PSD1 and planctomycete cytochrome C domain-containing protein [Rubripirellula sp.]
MLLFCMLLPCTTPRASATEQEDFFESRVRPLLVRKCYECHRRKAEGGLRLDSLKDILAGGTSGPAIVLGKPEQSLLWQVIAQKHSEITMPPSAPLKEGEVKAFERWIAEGAAWPKPIRSSNVGPKKNGSMDEYGITADERNFWSFQPLSQTAIENASDVEDATQNPIDAYITAAHRERGLDIAGTASPQALIRRITYDLTGLPVKQQESSDFVAHAAKDRKLAIKALVNRLLSSPHYGERWGQHWLDLVRYADTAGDAADFPIPEAYKYRNYVIDAFNEDKPYDQFIREQIAGDLLQANDEDERWDQTIATGYLTISRRIGVSPQNQPHITIEDTLNNLGKTFLGLSIGCARCHDHKFDPIPTSDYYALYGIFSSTTYPHAGAEHKPYRENFVYRIGDKKAKETLGVFRKELDKLRKQERAAFQRYRSFQTEPIHIPGYNRDIAWKEVLELRDQIAVLAETFPPLETAYAVREGDTGNAAIQKQGNPRALGPMVQRGFLQVLGGQTVDDSEDQSGRLQLADWIADPNNPLTARVIANRVWHHHFGRGIVNSTSDFGVRGNKPSHPQLLDFLAAYLIQHDWSIKALHRLILNSETYQRASQHVPKNAGIDPDNIYLWRTNRRRLDAEQLRDSVLAISGKLDLTVADGHPLPHHLTYYFRQHEPYVGNFDSDRRTIYLFRQRIRKNRFLDTFDAPDGNLHVGVRRPTTTSLQSLYFMNSAFIQDEANRITSHMLKTNPDFTTRIAWCYQTLFGRQPDSPEIKQTQHLISQASATSGDQTAWSSLIRAMLSSNEFLFVD